MWATGFLYRSIILINRQLNSSFTCMCVFYLFVNLTEKKIKLKNSSPFFISNPVGKRTLFFVCLHDFSHYQNGVEIVEKSKSASDFFLNL